MLGALGAAIVGLGGFWLYVLLQPQSDYFGEFKPEDIEGKFVQKTDTRPHFVVANDTVFKDPNNVEWFVPKGTEVDGASIPQALWSFAGPFEGNYLWASVIHDYYCDMRTKTAHDTHRTFYYGMRARGVGKVQADFMYWAVAVFGPQWANPVPSSTGAVESAQEAAEVNLDDPVVRAAALAKAAAIARTLKASSGEVLDSSNVGLVLNTLDNIDQNAAAYRGLLTSGDFLDRPKDLGLLAHWSDNMDEASFNDDAVPSVKYAASLTALTSGREAGADAFVVDTGTDRATLGNLLLKLNPPAQEKSTPFGETPPAIGTK
ncbi:DUF1353 domain-containing protein [Devosia sp. A16]|uniref:DUF1353 domain-containing protein n=1 Tax=Devosia sp. A16 TaxID=1736675 RepID=UPI0006D833ED|nr:DUF1353 domain-containing protein [Devosia sp. A16]